MYFVVSCVGKKTSVENNTLETKWSASYHECEQWLKMEMQRPDVLFCVISEAIEETLVKRSDLD